MAWLKTLDRQQNTLPVPISAEGLSALDSRLQLDECLRQLHVLTPKREILVGWEAVASLARLFPSTWVVGALGQRFPFRNLGRRLYGFVARNRYSLSKCRGTEGRLARAQWICLIAVFSFCATLSGKGA